ncbi:MAG: hypothetical protein K8H88_15395 [Sandaracinaceae bacterium]|nr:hypothetical protein [Sandaracinaceae bacterium]
MIFTDDETTLLRVWVRATRAPQRFGKGTYSFAGGAARHLLRLPGWVKKGEGRREWVIPGKMGFPAPMYLAPPRDARLERRDRELGLWLELRVPTEDAARALAQRMHAHRAAVEAVDEQLLLLAWHWPAGSLAYTSESLDIAPTGVRVGPGEEHRRARSEALLCIAGHLWLRRFEWVNGEDAEPVAFASSGAEPNAPGGAEPEGGADPQLPLFSPELEGSRLVPARPETEAEVRHGRVVRALADAMKQRGLPFGNDTHRDLYVVGTDGRTEWLFEVKTDATTTSIYTAVGQLMLHGRAAARETKLFLVVPERPPFALGLREIGIEVIPYDWHDGEPTFEWLPELDADD